MRRMVIVATLVVLAGCGSSGSTAAKPTDSNASGKAAATTVSMPDTNGCDAILTGGKPLTAADVKVCDNTAIVMTYDCDDGGEVHVLTVDDKTWEYKEGKPAAMAPKDYSFEQLGDFC